ncbi:ABC transporter ATP-binding protein [Micrococcales bacterium 31B]|nr:ABC transporter ATP-binding protein [Micrococcales bacterium 31B]
MELVPRPELASRSTDASQAPAAPSDAVVIDSISHSFGATRALDGLSLTAKRGEVTAVLGPNGAGKSTTINCCVGLLTPQSGTVQTFGFDPSRSTAGERARVGVMLQDGGLTSGARAGQLLAHAASLYANPWRHEILAEMLGISPFARTLVRRLSGGQRQRLALALALVGRPELVFLDEPTAGMDPQARHVVWDLVRDMRASGTSFVLTTHLLDEAERLADHVVIIDHGKVLAQGSVGELVAGAQEVPTSLTVRTGGIAIPEYMLENIPGVTLLETVSTGEYTLHGQITPALVRSLVGLAAQRGVLIRELTMGTPSLEDAYLNLTGKALR